MNINSYISYFILKVKFLKLLSWIIIKFLVYFYFQFIRKYRKLRNKLSDIIKKLFIKFRKWNVLRNNWFGFLKG